MPSVPPPERVTTWSVSVFPVASAAAAAPASVVVVSVAEWSPGVGSLVVELKLDVLDRSAVRDESTLTTIVNVVVPANGLRISSFTEHGLTSRRIEDLQASGLVAIHDGRVSVTRRGRFALDLSRVYRVLVGVDPTGRG